MSIIALARRVGPSRKVAQREAESCFLSEYRMEMWRIDGCVLTIPLFWIDIPLS